MASRMARRHRATYLVTQQTLTQAMKEAMELVKRLPRGDARSQELMNAYNQIAGVLRSGDPDLQSKFDDAQDPETAQMLKAAVDRVAQLKNEVSQAPFAAPGEVKQPQQTQNRTQASTEGESLKCPYGDGSFKNQQELDDHVDSVHEGRLASKESHSKEAPMSSRLFARKKKDIVAEDEALDAAPEAVAGEAPAEPLPEEPLPAAGAPAPAPAPAAPPAAGNSYANLPTEVLSAFAEAITKVDNWNANPAVLAAMEQIAEELKNRPVQPTQPEARTASGKVAVTPPGISESLIHKLKRQYPGHPEKAYATAWKIHNEKEGCSMESALKEAASQIEASADVEASQEKEAVSPPGWEGTVKEMKHHPEIDNPWALAWSMKDKGYHSHVKGSLKVANVREFVSSIPAPKGWEFVAAEMGKQGVALPNLMAAWMKDAGYTPHKANFLFKRRTASYWTPKFDTACEAKVAELRKSAENAGSGGWEVNEDTMNKVDGQPHEVKEIGEAHGKDEGVEQAEKHDSHPGAGVTTIKTPQELEKQAAAETAEVGKALKQATQLEKKLGELYLDAKPIIRANAHAAVRDAVESIYDSKNKFAEAIKVLNKHEMQAAAEEEAQKAAMDKADGKKEKKASAGPAFGLTFASAE